MLVRSATTGQEAAFVSAYSIEATRPKQSEISAVAAMVGKGRQLFISSVPTQTLPELAVLAGEARRAGLEPVVHLSARRMTSKAELDEFIARLRGDADVRRVLVIAGDVDQAGPYADALSVIRNGRLREAGIENIGISGYPEGHSRIDQAKIDAALPAKLSAAADAGLLVSGRDTSSATGGTALNSATRIRIAYSTCSARRRCSRGSAVDGSAGGGGSLGLRATRWPSIGRD